MATRTTPTFEWVGNIMRSQGVRQRLEQEGARREVMLRSLLIAMGHPEVPVVRTSGTRPGTGARGGAKRPYVRLSIPAEYEYGTATTPRLRVLPRVVRL